MTTTARAPRAQAPAPRPATATAALVRSNYVSGDEIERAEARTAGYEAVYQHPNDVGALGAEDRLVIDFDSVLFGDRAAAARVALAALRAGATVAVHTRTPDEPTVARLLGEPGVTWARTHRALRAALDRSRVAS